MTTGVGGWLFRNSTNGITSRCSCKEYVKRAINQLAHDLLMFKQKKSYTFSHNLHYFDDVVNSFIFKKNSNLIDKYHRLISKSFIHSIWIRTRKRNLRI